MTDVGEARPGPDPAPEDVDRLEALEGQVRQLTSRLAGWVEAQLVQALDDRRNDMKSLRSEMQTVLNAQLSAMRAETSSVVSVATRRLEVAQEQLAERVDAVAERAADAAAKATTLGGSSSAEAERLEALEQRVRSAMSRLSDSVEARLAEVDEIRQAELDALRSEMRVVVDERVGQTAPAAGLSAVQDRLAALATSVDQRLDDVAGRAVAAADRVASLAADVEAGPARIDAFEQRVKTAMSRVTDSVESRLAETTTTRAADLEALRSELTNRMDDLQRTGSAVDQRLDAVAQRAAAVGEDLGALRADVVAAAARSDELEQRVKAAVGRLAESVETRLAEFAAARSAEVDTAATALRARIAQVQEQLKAVAEEHRDARERAGELVGTKLAEVAEQRQAELEALKGELEGTLAAQLRQARGEIGMAVADAHRRFVVSVDLLEERMQTVSEQATAAWSAVAGLETLQETVTSDGRRLEALETHTRRTDARLGAVVEAKLAEQAGHRGVQLEEVRDQLRAAVDKVQEQVTTTLGGVPALVGTAVDGLRGQMRAALDAHLAETRAEVTLALGEGRAELAAGAAELEALQVAFDQQAARTVASLDTLSASVEKKLKDGEARLARTVQSKLAGFEAVAAQVAAQVAADRAALDASLASVNRKVARAQDQVQKRMEAVTEQVEALTRAAATSAGSLAPLRSDLRLLQDQVAELARVVEDLRPRRRSAPPAGNAPVAPAKRLAAERVAAPRRKATAAPTKAATAAPAKKATAARARKAPRRAQ